MIEARRRLDVRDLSISRDGKLKLEKFSLSLNAGETLVVVGEADSGTDALLRVLGNFPERCDAASGTVRFGDGEPRAVNRHARPAIRISYVCGPSSMPLNPHASAVSQLARIVARRQVAPGSTGREELRLALERFAQAPVFASLARKPLELSAVDLAWALLATATAQKPDLLIADQLFARLTPMAVKALSDGLMEEQKRQGFALVYAAQELLTAAHLRGRTIVLHRGKVVEEGDFDKLASGQSHVYTQTLFKVQPRLAPVDSRRNSARGEPLLKVQNLDLATRKRRSVRPRDGITFELRRGAALALVGGDGSGRRALVRAMLGLDRFSNGRVVLDQVDISALSGAMKSRLRRRIAFIAGADETLDPRMTLWDVVDEPLRAHLRLPRAMIAGHRKTALKRVGLVSRDGRTKVSTLSTFDKRRLQVARAIVSAPLLAVIDEPLRGLDAFAQSIMLELLSDLRKHEAPAFLVVTADLGVAQALADDLMIFKDSKLVESGPLAAVLCAPKDAETRRLLAAAQPGKPAPPEPQAPAAPPIVDLVQLLAAAVPFEHEFIGHSPAEIAATEGAG